MSEHVDRRQTEFATPAAERRVFILLATSVLVIAACSDEAAAPQHDSAVVADSTVVADIEAAPDAKVTPDSKVTPDTGLICAGGASKCGDKCVDLQNDPANCGACATACKSGEVCAAGT